MLSIGDSLFPEKLLQAYGSLLYASLSAAYNYFWTSQDFTVWLYWHTLHRFPLYRKPPSFHGSDLKKHADSYPQIFLCAQYTFLSYLKQPQVCLSFVFFSMNINSSSILTKLDISYRQVTDFLSSHSASIQKHRSVLFLSSISVYVRYFIAQLRRGFLLAGYSKNKDMF